ncbi:MAG TPA: VOC family protein [Gemmatimonadales bacterium]|jgi:PhnB protein
MSPIQLSPFINFQGRAREAMEQYQKVLGGKLEIQAGPDGRIGQARLETDGVLVIGSDGHPDYPAKVGENMALSLAGTDGPRLTRIFSDLAEGGKVNMPLAKQPWGGEVGWLVDRFGIAWTVSIHQA